MSKFIISVWAYNPQTTPIEGMDNDSVHVKLILYML